MGCGKQSGRSGAGAGGRWTLSFFARSLRYVMQVRALGSRVLQRCARRTAEGNEVMWWGETRCRGEDASAGRAGEVAMADRQAR